MADDGLARPRDFESRDAAGLELGLALGGGGLYLLAWHVAYLHELAQHHLHLRKAPRVVGTSAGSVMATGLTAGRLGMLHATISVLDHVPAFIGHLAPAADLAPSQNRALELFLNLPDTRPETLQAVGHAALAAQTPPASQMARTIGTFLGVRKWPAPNLHTTCVDTYTGDRCVVTQAAGVHPARAVAASSAIPGVFAPQPIGDRKCMDGGVSWSGVHLDVVAGADRAIVLVLPPSMHTGEDRLGKAANLDAELDELRASGTDVFVRWPDAPVEPTWLMDPARVAPAFELGTKQARADVDALKAFLA